jgi:CNT family concentrative nucleoside transporter
LCRLVAMADIREPHNASPQEGVARNNDPALDIAHEHNHPHVHHSPRAAHPDNVVYSSGTTDDKPSEFFAASSHPPAMDEKHQLGKANGYDYEVEKATGTSSDPDMEGERRKSPYSLSSLYRKYRLPVHIFIGMLFTG